MKRIIVEGMDATGKSTLIRTLQEQFHNLRVVVNEKGPDQDFNFWWPNIIYDSMIQPPYVPIHDRFFYSELVYGRVLRGSVNADAIIEARIQHHLRLNAMLIYCRPDRAMIRSTFNSKEQMSGVIENFDKLVKFYDKLMSEEQHYYGVRYTSWNWAGEDARLIISRVERYLQV